jgi:uncharacterized metal-binding protein YceD (DUF177 family)
MQKDFSYPLKIDELNQGEQLYKLNADKDELKVLAEILQVPAVNSFNAELKLKFQKKKGILTVWGKICANLHLISVISLDEFDKDYETDFNVTYDTNATYEDIKEIDEDINCNIPDIVMNGEIDLGDIAIEHLALILDDHPRKDGEEFSSIIEDVTPVKNNPFASLAKLKK